jgi:hypothetical protein
MNGAAIVFGWPMIVASIFASLAGLSLRRSVLVWCGAVLSLPFMLYVVATPRFWPLGAVAAPSGLLAAAAATYRRWGFAWLLFAVTPVAVAAVAYGIAGAAAFTIVPVLLAKSGMGR